MNLFNINDKVIINSKSLKLKNVKGTITKTSDFGNLAYNSYEVKCNGFFYIVPFHEIARDGKPQKALKFDDGKPPLELLSNEALTQIAQVFGKGVIKYGRWNYKKGLTWGRVIGAAFRHLSAFNSGQNLDPETQLSHIAHLGACVFMLLDYIKEHPELDNRYKKIK